jgi:hypothetical protein
MTVAGITSGMAGAAVARDCAVNNRSWYALV